MVFNIDNHRLPSNHPCSKNCCPPQMIVGKMKESKIGECYKAIEHGYNDKHTTNDNESLQIHALKQILKFIKTDDADTEESERATCHLIQSLKNLIENEDNDHNPFESFLNEFAQANKVSDVGTDKCNCNQSNTEGCISVHSSFLSKMRFVLGDDFVTDWGLIFDNDTAHKEQVVVKKEMITNALDRLMTERIIFLTELNTLYDLAEYSLFHK